MVSIYESHGVEFTIRHGEVHIYYKGKKFLSVDRDRLNYILDELPPKASYRDLKIVANKYNLKLNNTQLYLLLKILAHPIFGFRRLVRERGRVYLVSDNFSLNELRRMEIIALKDLYKDFEVF